MATPQFAQTGVYGRSIQLAQGTTIPWGQLGVSGDTANGLGLANPRSTSPNPATETVPRWYRFTAWLNVGLTIAEALKTFVGPPPIRVSEIAIGDAVDLAIRIYGKSYLGAEAGTAVFIRGIGGPSLGVAATITEDGLYFDAAALERAYGKTLPALLNAATAPPGWAGPTVVERRDSEVDSRLSAIGAKARSLVASQARFQRWEAHHLIPFDSMRRLPRIAQLAIVRSGWIMDSIENLVVLPADEATYEAAPNFRVLPYHRGPHGSYNSEVSNRLSHLAWAAPSMDDREIRDELREIEAAIFQRLLDRKNGYHRRVSFNATPQPSAFG